MKKIIGLVVVWSLVLMVISGCSSSTGLEVVVGDRCEPASEQVYLEGLYRSERYVSNNYYTWSFIRFFEDCTYHSFSSFYENPSKVAQIYLDTIDGDKNAHTVGYYSVEGSSIKMKSDASELIGTISAETLDLEIYYFKTRKSDTKHYTYHPVDAIWQDIIQSITPVVKEAPAP